MRVRIACQIQLMLLAGGICWSLAGFAAPDQWATCAACHGTHAQGNASQQAPALAGQHDWYIIRQLENYAAGIRGSHRGDRAGRLMMSQSFGLDDRQRQRLAEFVSGLEPVSTRGTRRGNMMNGSRYYQARCGGCHGPQGEGNENLQAPRLQGLSPQYLTLQLRNFQRGIRGRHEADRYGRQMAMMASTITDDDWRDILYYLTEQH
jgi:cytochrome c553